MIETSTHATGMVPHLPDVVFRGDPSRAAVAMTAILKINNLRTLSGAYATAAPAGACWLLLRLACYHDAARGYSWPSVARVAQECGVHEETARGWLAKLEQTTVDGVPLVTASAGELEGDRRKKIYRLHPRLISHPANGSPTVPSLSLNTASTTSDPISTGVSPADPGASSRSTRSSPSVLPQIPGHNPANPGTMVSSRSSTDTSGTDGSGIPGASPARGTPIDQVMADLGDGSTHTPDRTALAPWQIAQVREHLQSVERDFNEPVASPKFFTSTKAGTSHLERAVAAALKSPPPAGVLAAAKPTQPRAHDPEKLRQQAREQRRQNNGQR